MRKTAIALLFYLVFVFNAYADGLEGTDILSSSYEHK
jgi:hypothetical protein